MKKKINSFFIRYRLYFLCRSIAIISVFACLSACNNQKKLSKDVLEINDFYMSKDTLNNPSVKPDYDAPVQDTTR